MKSAVLEDIFKKKKIIKLKEKYIRYNVEDFSDVRIPEITVHGRFQSSLHVNHFYTYVATGFRIAEKVHFLITNPDLKEHNANKKTLNREKIENNPFTYEERIFMIESFLNELCIPKERYDFAPFKITSNEEWEKVLDKNIPNLVNTYGEWSKDKLRKFKKGNFQVIHSKFPKIVNISGTKIREILKLKCSSYQKGRILLQSGHMKEAVPSLLQISEKNRLKKHFKTDCPKKIKIIATLSQKIDSSKNLIKLQNAGVDIFRLNMAHQTQKRHKSTIDRIRQQTPKCKIMVDIQGPAVRLGKFKNEIFLNKNNLIKLVSEKKKQNINKNKLYINHQNFYKDVNPGDIVLLGNGKIKSQVINKKDKEVALEILNSGYLYPFWHVNLYMKNSSLPDLSKKDYSDLDLAIQKKIDIIAISFTRNAYAIKKVKKYLKEKKAGKIKIFAKIETKSGVENAEEIIKKSDGVIVARGDLGVETPLEELAIKQEKIITLALKNKKPCIIATEMLKSMTNNILPTCAEVTDVSLAVWQGADSIMLSEETANSFFPVESVKISKKIIEAVNK